MYQIKSQHSVKAKALANGNSIKALSIMVGFALFFMAVMVNANSVQNELLGVIEQSYSEEPENTKESYLAHADKLLGQEQFTQAIRFYNKVIRIDRKVDEAFLGRSIAYSGIGRLEESIADLNIFILRNPDHSMAHVFRGIRYMSQGNYESAEDNLLRAVQLNPRNARAYDDLGVLYAQTGNVEHALRYFGQALRLDPYNETAYHNLAIAYFLLEDHKKALGAVNRAIRLTPEARDTYVLKAQILDALGRDEEAKKVRHYAKFLNDGQWSGSAAIN